MLSEFFSPFRYATRIPLAEGNRHYLSVQNFISRWRKPILFLALAFTAIAFIPTLLGLVIKYAENGRSLDPSSQEFALYKNTYYTTYSNKSISECEGIARGKEMTGTEGEIQYWNQGISPDTFRNCFSSAKVIPSTPRHSAFGYNGLEMLLTQTITIATGMWAFLSLIKLDEECPFCSEETTISKFQYALFLFDIAQQVIWWYGYISLAANPSHASPVAIMSWVTPWRYIYSMSLPPISNHIKPRRAGSHHEYAEPQHSSISGWIVVPVVLAVLQWIASASIIGLTKSLGMSTVKPSPSFVRYNLQENFYATAPGDSNCTADTISGLTGLFTSPLVEVGKYGSSSTMAAYITSFVINSLAALYATWLFMTRRGSPWRSIAITVFALLFTDYIILAISMSPASQAAGAILYHKRCNAVHVTMSPNKAYMDVNSYGSAWRYVKGWFGV
jgi:hypothetical protein